MGRIHYPRSLPWTKRHGILFVHGTPPDGKETGMHAALYRKLIAHGYLVFAIDLRGFGESGKVSRRRVPEDLDFVADVRSARSTRS